MEVTADQRTISAREGLLDAVEALEPHGEAVILVGAQAVYMRVCLISLLRTAVETIDTALS